MSPNTPKTKMDTAIVPREIRLTLRLADFHPSARKYCIVVSLTLIDSLQIISDDPAIVQLDHTLFQPVHYRSIMCRDVYKRQVHVDAVVAAAKETGAIVTAEEHSIIGGLGSAVCEVAGEMCPVPIERVGIRDVFGQSGTPDELMQAYCLTRDDIAHAAVRAIDRIGT